MRACSVFLSSQDWEEARGALLTADDHENAGAFLCGVSESDSRIRLLVRRFVPVPNALYTDRLPYHLEVSPTFYNSVISQCIQEKLHPIIVHSHPHGAARYSPSDDHGESRLLQVLEDLLPGTVVASMLVTPITIAGRRLTQKGFAPLSGIRILGLRIQNSLSKDSGQADRQQALGEQFDRQVRAFGLDSQRLLDSLHVGVVGVGGTGSIVAEQLVRVGIGKLTIVDNDKLDATNLSRVVGATRHDLRKPKVDVANHHLARSGDARIIPINDSAIRQDVLMRLRDCDAVFSCVDNDRTRALLNRFAYQYLVPVIDVGVRIDARSGNVSAAAGRVSVVGTGSTCLRCSHHIDPERIRAESLPKNEREKLALEGYVMGVADPVPSVITLNATIAGLGATAFINLFANLTGGLQPAGQIYDATSGAVLPVSQVHEGGCDVCDPRIGVKALGDLQIVSAY